MGTALKGVNGRSVIWLKCAFLLTTALSAQSAHADMQLRPKVIYGDDNRLEYYQVPQPIKVLADSTVSLFESSRMKVDAVKKTVSYSNRIYGDVYNLCSAEPFREQPAPAFCSGFLVGKDLIATAGHCIDDESVCADTKFVFGFKLTGAGKVPSEFPEQNVYSCKKLVARVLDDSGKDFAIVQLDREAQGRKPLKIRRTGQLRVGDAITVIGHPAGIPMKIAGGASVRRVESDYFVANLDVYGGNSGSAVFNLRTSEVEGILVRGEEDFEFKGSCFASKVCDNASCRGEDVTWSSAIANFVPAL